MGVAPDASVGLWSTPGRIGMRPLHKRWALWEWNRMHHDGLWSTLVASSERIRQQLGWQPKIPELGDIIASAWEWHRTHQDGLWKTPGRIGMRPLHKRCALWEWHRTHTQGYGVLRAPAGHLKGTISPSVILTVISGSSLPGRRVMNWSNTPRSAA